eukprot:TRINITY_DN11524_c0_g1_i1.p1 TRINITY_DN11524_c0_g1~~TRINITY_DN11524_c0_g1_i1.p1  ORF type:complete len:112 (-),score=10.80 TRINITY_DN11524_c0_g1_i1:16-351(-)
MTEQTKDPTLAIPQIECIWNFIALGVSEDSIRHKISEFLDTQKDKKWRIIKEPYRHKGLLKYSIDKLRSAFQAGLRDDVVFYATLLRILTRNNGECSVFFFLDLLLFIVLI